MSDHDKRLQNRAPLFVAMRAYGASGAAAFHTPGHKQGLGAHAALRSLLTDEGLRTEVSLMEELDDLHEPSSCIKEAQDLAASLYGADATHFCVNGTTGAIHAMLLAALQPGDTVLVPRNAHRSIIGGIMLSGAAPVFMQPEIDAELGIAMNVAPETVAAAAAAHPKAVAAVLINPNYYGVACDLRRIADIVHARGMRLLVDEAHGAHLKFCADLPMQALDAGADIVAQSTHKLLGSLTQTSMLHARFKRVDAARLRTMNTLAQSTSPNYLLLASLDIARMQMALEGETLVARAVALAGWARREINAIAGLYCFGKERLGSGGAFALDATKLTVSTAGLGVSGAQAESVLRREYGIQSELSDAGNVLFIISYADTETSVGRLLAALRSFSASLGEDRKKSPPPPPLPAIPEMRILPRSALFSAKFATDFVQAAGKISGEMITFYPPGIPVICPGEVISEEIIAYCLAMKTLGLKVAGPADTTLKKILAVK